MDLQLQEGEYKKALQEGIAFSTVVPCKSPTEFVVFVIYDRGGGRLGSRWVMAR